jgi:hypothetical protein
MTRLLLTREDWTLFRNIETLGQKAGVPPARLPHLVVKELVDNALDVGATCSSGRLPDGGFFVEDDGPGLPGDDGEVAALFSVRRPLCSSKLIRLPTRGALGNGLRVVAGAVLASGGTLAVRTCGRRLELQPQDDGSTRVLAVEGRPGAGTRVEVRLGPELPAADPGLFLWANLAVDLAGRGVAYSGRSSPWWYDSDAFFDLCQALGENLVRELVAKLEGCGGGRAGTVAGEFLRRRGNSLTRDEADQLLAAARAQGRLVKPSRLGAVGRMDSYPGYAREAGSFEVKAARGHNPACIPFVIEAWARPADRPAAQVCVNRTPVVADSWVRRSASSRTEYALLGCNLGYTFKVGRSRDFDLLVNVCAPHLQLTTDGKEPDLEPVADPLLDALEAAARRCGRAARGAAGGSAMPDQKDVILGALPDAIRRASGDGASRYSLRQLFYIIRPRFIEAFGAEPDYGYFSRVIAEHEDSQGQELPGIYRDNRGVLYHPHTGEEVPLGTRSVEEYRRPAWTFNKVLYCEKEGFFPLLRDVQWPERHDCALLTSKGFATRAARDALVLLGGTDEPLTFFCIHDADGPGTLIYEKLQEGVSAASPRRRAEVVNLGLEPEEARSMGLAVEPVQRKDGKAVPVARYVSGQERDWLQKNRIELNAMTTPQFLAWLDAKMQGQPGKLVPPPAVLNDRLADDVRACLRDDIVARVMREAGVDVRVARAFAALAPELARLNPVVEGYVRAALGDDGAQEWSAPVRRLAVEVVSKGGGATPSRGEPIRELPED